MDKIRKRKIFLLLTKYSSHILGLAYAIYTLLGLFGIDGISIGYFFTVSLFTWTNIYSASWALEFCYVHRLPLYYILIDEILLVIDTYIGIPIDWYNLLALHLLIIAILIFGYTYYYKHR